MNKRAVELEFNWIFIIIAGAVILSFFFVVAQKQKTVSQARLALEISTQLESAFVSAIQSTQTQQSMPLPSEGITLSCGKTQLCDCKYSAFGKQTDFGDKIIFGPNKLNDYSAQLWAPDWQAPFRATNFLLITTTKIKYVIVYSESDAPIRDTKTQIVRDLPAALKIQLVKEDELPSIKYDEDQTRIVFLIEPDINSIELLSKGKGVSAVYIDKIRNKAIFYNKKENSNNFERIEKELLTDTSSSKSINDAMIYAAIFAQDPHLFECQTKEAYKKLNYVAQIVSKRAETLSQLMQEQNRPQCATLYPVQPAQTLEKIQNAAQKAAQNIAEAQSILPLARQLQTQNTDLVTTSCPPLY